VVKTAKRAKARGRGTKSGAVERSGSVRGMRRKGGRARGHAVPAKGLLSAGDLVLEGTAGAGVRVAMAGVAPRGAAGERGAPPPLPVPIASFTI
jgi:hypothetical protein